MTSELDPYIPLPRVAIVDGRQGYVVERCRNRRVLHVGCVDSGLECERLVSGDLMHARLALSASELWGLDVDVEGLEHLRAAGFTNLEYADVCKSNWWDVLPHTDFDTVVASEVIEHLANPGAFLSSLRTVMPPDAELVVTVPNAFRYSTLRWLLRGVEFIHPDHNYWFSYHTILTLLRKHGFQPTEVATYTLGQTNLWPRWRQSSGGDDAAPADSPVGKHRLLTRGVGYLRDLPRRAIVRFLLSRSPFWADGIIVVSQPVSAR